MSQDKEFGNIIEINVRGGRGRVKRRKMTKKEKTKRLTEIALVEQDAANSARKLQERDAAIARLRLDPIGRDVLKALMID